MLVRRLVVAMLALAVLRTLTLAQEMPRSTPPTPGVVGRPLAWPGGPRVSEMQSLEMTTVVARVGPEVILAGDVCASVREQMAENVDKIPVGQAEMAASMFLKQSISNAVDRKLLFLETKRRFVDEEQTKKIYETIDEDFEKSQLKPLLRRYGAANRAELESMLAARGTTMEREKQNYRELALASEAIKEATKKDEEITHDDMISYYHDHATDFDRAARAHWHQLFVSRLEKSALEAKNKIAWMGNQVQSGQSWAAVAKHHSDDASAVEGGDRGWTTKDSLKSQTLNTALFTLPLGAMSPILEDELGWHIIRVVEREEGGRVPFEEAQQEIREKIKEQRRRNRVQNYVEVVRQKTKVWTIFDEKEEADRLAAYLAAPIAEYLRQTARRAGRTAFQSSN